MDNKRKDTWLSYTRELQTLVTQFQYFIHVIKKKNFKIGLRFRYDRLHMVHPLLTQATDIFFCEYIPNRNISVDEAMIGFKAKSSIKQYMPMKPTKQGYTVWSLCDSHNGYLC